MEFQLEHRQGKKLPKRVISYNSSNDIKFCF